MVLNEKCRLNEARCWGWKTLLETHPTQIQSEESGRSVLLTIVVVSLVDCRVNLCNVCFAMFVCNAIDWCAFASYSLNEVHCFVTERCEQGKWMCKKSGGIFLHWNLTHPYPIHCTSPHQLDMSMRDVWAVMRWDEWNTVGAGDVYVKRARNVIMSR